MVSSVVVGKSSKKTPCVVCWLSVDWEKPARPAKVSKAGQTKSRAVRRMAICVNPAEGRVQAKAVVRGQARGVVQAKGVVVARLRSQVRAQASGELMHQVVVRPLIASDQRSRVSRIRCRPHWVIQLQCLAHVVRAGRKMVSAVAAVPVSRR